MSQPQPVRSGHSLRLRVFVIVAAIIVPAMCLLSYLTHAETKRYAESAAEEYGRVASTDFERWVLRFRDAFDLVEFDAELARRLATWEQAREIAVFEFEDGRLRLLSHRGVGLGREPSDLDFSAAIDGVPVMVKTTEGGVRFLDVARPVRKSGATVGVVRLRFSLANVDEAVARSGDLVAAFSVGVVVILGVVLFFYLGRLVTDPVLGLVAAMREAASGDRRAFGDVSGSAEIAWLASSLTRLMAKIRESEGQNSRLLVLLSGMNDALQAKVREATSELAKRNIELHAGHERLFSAQRDAQRLERMATLGQLTAEIAHEIGTPLNAVSGHIQLLHRESGLPKMAQERLRVIESEIDRLASIVRDFLKTLRPPEPVLAPIDLYELAADVLRFTSPLLESKGVLARAEREGDAVRLVMADRGQIEQVLLNLVVNAMDALQRGGSITISVAAAPSARDGRDGVEARVADDGGGISPEKMKDLFLPFKSTKERGRGSGLGLAISREILRRHGGEIRAESVAGRGTTFVVWLPAVAPAEPESGDGADTDGTVSEEGNPRART